MIKKRFLIACSLLFSQLTFANQVTILGVELPYHLTIMKQFELVRNGYAVANLMGRPGYVGALYTTNLEKSAESLILTDENMVMQFYFVRDDLPASLIASLFLENILLNNKELVEGKIEAQKIEELSGIIRDNFNAGDVLSFIYSTQSGLMIYRNNQMLKQWPNGKSFFNMLLRTWIGKFPPNKAFKRAILNFPIE